MSARFQVSDSVDPTGDTASQFADMLAGLLVSVTADEKAPPVIFRNDKREIVWRYGTENGDREMDIRISGPYKI